MLFVSHVGIQISVHNEGIAPYACITICMWNVTTTVAAVEPLNGGHHRKCLHGYGYPCFNLLSLLEDEVHGETDDGKANANAGEDGVDYEQGTADVDKLLILGNSN